MRYGRRVALAALVGPVLAWVPMGCEAGSEVEGTGAETNEAALARAREAMVRETIAARGVKDARTSGRLRS